MEQMDDDNAVRLAGQDIASKVASQDDAEESSTCSPTSRTTGESVTIPSTRRKWQTQIDRFKSLNEQSKIREQELERLKRICRDLLVDKAKMEEAIDNSMKQIGSLHQSTIMLKKENRVLHLKVLNLDQNEESDKAVIHGHQNDLDKLRTTNETIAAGVKQNDLDKLRTTNETMAAGVKQKLVEIVEKLRLATLTAENAVRTIQARNKLRKQEGCARASGRTQKEPSMIGKLEIQMQEVVLDQKPELINKQTANEDTIAETPELVLQKLDKTIPTVEKSGSNQRRTIMAREKALRDYSTPSHTIYSHTGDRDLRDSVSTFRFIEVEDSNRDGDYSKNNKKSRQFDQWDANQQFSFVEAALVEKKLRRSTELGLLSSFFQMEAGGQMASFIMSSHSTYTTQQSEDDKSRVYEFLKSYKAWAEESAS